MKLTEYISFLRDESKNYNYGNYKYPFDPFDLDDQKKEFLEIVENNNAVITKHYRQCGMTSLISAIIAYEMIKSILSKKFYNGKIYKIAFITFNQSACIDMKNKVVSNLKKTTGLLINDNDPNKIELSNKKCKSILYLGSDKNFFTDLEYINRLCVDNAAFIKNDYELYSSLKSLLVKKDYKILLSSVPNGHDNLFYDIYRYSLDSNYGFKIFDFYWFLDKNKNHNLKWAAIKDSNEIYHDNDPSARTALRMLNLGFYPFNEYTESFINCFYCNDGAITQEIYGNFL